MQDDLNAITARNALTSPLLRLPAELRQQIYVYVIDNTGKGRTVHYMDRQDFIQGLVRKRQPHELLDKHAYPSSYHWLGLVLVCHQINCEAAHLPLELSLVNCTSLRRVQFYLAVVSKQRFPPKKLRLEIPRSLTLWEFKKTGPSGLAEMVPTLRSVEVRLTVWIGWDSSMYRVVKEKDRLLSREECEKAPRAYLTGGSGGEIEVAFSG